MTKSASMAVAQASVEVADEQTEQFIYMMANGMTLVAERMPSVRSAAMSLLVPAGAMNDPQGAGGSSSVLSDWLLRGAGTRDSHELTSYLDGLGVQRSSNADTVFLRFGASMQAKNLLAVLPVYGDILQRPQLPEEGFEPARDLALQQLDAIEDEPSHKLGLLLRGNHYDYPYGRPSVGVREDLERLTGSDLRGDFGRRMGPQGTILAVAGMFDWNELKGAVNKEFGGWGRKAEVKLVTHAAKRGVTHVNQETNQVQIGLAYDTLPESDPQSLLVQTVLNVLSGGMGARLFSEIREKQGLCYSVNAGYHSFRDRAAVFGYAGTAPERAQRTLDSFLVELRRINQGITRDELDRAIIMMKSRVIMQGESSGARAGAIAYDFYHRGHTRTLDDVRALIEAITLEKVNEYLSRQKLGNLTVVTIGPNELKV